MNIPADKILHLQGGAAIGVVLLIVVLLAVHVGLWAGLALGVVAFNVGVELYQKVRREGEPSWADAATGSLPGLVLAGGLFAAGM